jgi:hypothetical protein
MSGTLKLLMEKDGPLGRLVGEGAVSVNVVLTAFTRRLELPRGGLAFSCHGIHNRVHVHPTFCDSVSFPVARGTSPHRAPVFCHAVCGNGR